MSKYDLVSIVRPTAEDSIVEELHKTITDLITTNGGIRSRSLAKKKTCLSN